MGTSYNPKIVTNGLILNLDAANRKSYPGAGNQFTDIAKNKNKITLYNSPTFSTNNNGYFTFNGTNQYGLIQSPILQSSNYDKTIISWCKPNSSVTAESWRGIIGMGGRSNVTPSNSILLAINTMTSTFYVNVACWYNDYQGTEVPIIKDSWNMVGVIANSAGIINNLTIFCINSNGINFSNVSTSAYIRGLNTTISNLTVGCTDVPGRYYKGEIASILMYNRMLSQSEIIQYYNASKGRFIL